MAFSTLAGVQGLIVVMVLPVARFSTPNGVEEGSDQVKVNVEGNDGAIT